MCIACIDCEFASVTFKKSIHPFTYVLALATLYECGERLPALKHAKVTRRFNAANSATTSMQNSHSRRYSILMPLPFELRQIVVPFPLFVSLPLQTPSRDLDIEPYILDQALFTHVIILRPYKTHDQKVHACAIEVMMERMQDVDFLHHRISTPPPTYALPLCEKPTTERTVLL